MRRDVEIGLPAGTFHAMIARVAFFGAIVALVGGTLAPVLAQVAPDPPARPIENYDEILELLRAGDAAVRESRGANGLPNILLTGYWPPTNEMIRHFSDNPIQNPDGWAGDNWEDRGYNVYAFFPEFPDGPSGEFPFCSWGRGVGDLEVDYQDTTADWAVIVDQIRPVAIITFSRGVVGDLWELEFVQRNLETWVDDADFPNQPTPAPPDLDQVAGYTRCTALPTHDVVAAVDDAALGLDVFVDENGFGGGYLSEFIAYLGTWYHGTHSGVNEPNRTLAAGHIHVGFTACEMDTTALTAAVEETLRVLIETLDAFDPQVVGDRCPTCCLGTPVGTSAYDSQEELSVDCSVNGLACCRGTDEPYVVRCTNRESFDVAVSWNLCNDDDDCPSDDETDVGFATFDAQACDAFGCGGGGSVQGSHCGCARSGTSIVPASSHLDIPLDVECPSWQPLPVGCGPSECCSCMQDLELQCSDASATHSDGGDRACQRFGWFPTSADTPSLGGIRRMKPLSFTLADCPGDADVVGPGEPVFPLVTVDPAFEIIPTGGSTFLDFDVTNAAVDERQFDFHLDAVHVGGQPHVFSLTTISGASSSAGDGTASVTGQTLPVPSGESLSLSVRVDGVLEPQLVENAVVIEVTDPSAPHGVTISAHVTQDPAAGTVSGQVGSSLEIRKTGGDLQLFWSASCLVSDDDYAVYEGALGTFTGHVPLVCSTGGFTQWVVTPSAGSAYYLIVPTDGDVEGSYGLDSDGAERPSSPSACRAQVLGFCGDVYETRVSGTGNRGERTGGMAHGPGAKAQRGDSFRRP